MNPMVEIFCCESEAHFIILLQNKNSFWHVYVFVCVNKIYFHSVECFCENLDGKGE